MIKKQELKDKLETANNLVDRFSGLYKDQKTIPTKITKQFLKNLKSKINE
jgi:hypothetical protein